jgi:hypothetical protein
MRITAVALVGSALLITTKPVDGLSIQSKPADAWIAVLRIPAGRMVRLDVDEKGIIEGRLVVADETGIRLINTGDPAIPRKVIQVCADALADSPSGLKSTLTGGEFIEDGVRVAPAGVFFHGQRVADLEQIVLRVDRAAINTVAIESNRRRTGLLLIAVGTASSIIGGLVQNIESGSSIGSAIGVPLIIAGIIKLHHSSRDSDVVYKRSSPSIPQLAIVSTSYLPKTGSAVRIGRSSS